MFEIRAFKNDLCSLESEAIKTCLKPLLTSRLSGQLGDNFTASLDTGAKMLKQNYSIGNGVISLREKASVFDKKTGQPREYPKSLQIQVQPSFVKGQVNVGKKFIGVMDGLLQDPEFQAWIQDIEDY